MGKIEKDRRINRIIKSIKEKYFSSKKESEKNKTTKTLLVKVQEEKYENQWYLDSEKREILDKILDDAEEKRLEVLGKCYEEFKKNPLNLIENAASIVNLKKNKISLKVYNDKNGEIIKTQFVCPQCGEYEIVYLAKDNKYFSACSKDLEHTERSVQLKKTNYKETDDDGKTIFETDVFEIGKFKGQILYKYLYTSFAKSNSYKNYASAVFYESLLYNVAKEICSFLDKYYNIKTEIIVNINKNKKIFDSNKKLMAENNIEFDYLLGEEYSSKKDSIKYNQKIVEMNMFLNEKVFQNESIARETKEKIKYFGKLKDFPSFPIVEKEAILYTEEEILKKFEIFFKENENETISFWSNLTKSKLGGKEEKNNKEEEENIKKSEGILEKYYYPYKDKKNKEKLVREIIGSYFDFFKKHTTSHKDLINCVMKKINSKIRTLENHLSNEETKLKDGRSRKALVEWYIGKSVVFLEYLRESNFKKFIGLRREFDELASILKGYISKKENKTKTFEITGFSEGKKAAILINTKAVGKEQFALGFNIFRENSEFKVVENGGNLKGYVLQDGSNILANIQGDLKGTMILPLALGKRQGREYLYNEFHNFKNGGKALNNARIIRKFNEIKNKNEYFIAITFTKNRGNDFSEFSNEYKAIIGVDRGEKIPVVATITGLDGNQIGETLYIGFGNYEKQKRIQEKKESEASQKGGYNAELHSKAKNISDNLVEKIAIELLYYANKHRALIVFEDLARGFGRGGKKTIMSNRQYTKIEDYLVQKLGEHGLLNKRGDVVVNTRNGLFGKVIAKHTSKTCSSCGFVYKYIDMKKCRESLIKKNGVWYVKLDNKEISLKNLEYETYDRENKIKKTLTTEGVIEEFIEDKNLNELLNNDSKCGKTDKERLEKILFHSLNPRKKQDEFICPVCKYEAKNADEQASLNIARRWIFEKEGEIEAIKENKFDKKEKKYLSSPESCEYKKNRQEKKEEDKNGEQKKTKKKVEDNENKKDYVEYWERYYKRKIKDGWKLK